jgi:hypothetical protein
LVGVDKSWEKDEMPPPGNRVACFGQWAVAIQGQAQAMDLGGRDDIFGDVLDTNVLFKLSVFTHDGVLQRMGKNQKSWLLPMGVKCSIG